MRVVAPEVSSLFFTSVEFMRTARTVLVSSHGKGLQRDSYVVNVTLFNVGMAYELLYKVYSLIDQQRPLKTHKFTRLNAHLTTQTRSLIEAPIKTRGWSSAQGFAKFLDTDIRHGDRRYYEQHSIYDTFPTSPDLHAFLGLEALYWELVQGG